MALKIRVETADGLGELVGIKHRPWGDFHMFRLNGEGYVWVLTKRLGTACVVKVQDRAPKKPKRIFIEDVEITMKRQRIEVPSPPPTWEEILAFNQKRLYTPPLLDVGDEKVTVGVPWDSRKMYVAKKFFENLASLKLPANTTFIFDTAKRPGKYKQQRVASSHNLLKQEALDNGSKYFFLIEADNLPPADAYPRLKTLIEQYGADAANIPYGSHTGPQGPIFSSNPELCSPICWLGTYPKIVEITFNDLMSAAYPFKVISAGFGCTLFTRKTVGEKPWFEDGGRCTDITFAARVIKENLQFLVDNRLFCQHLCCPNCYKKLYGVSASINIEKTLKKLFAHRDWKILRA